MSRWLLAGGLVALVLVLACKPRSFSPSTGDDGGGDDGGACNCDVPTTTGEVIIPCGESACAGSTGYQCTLEGVALAGAGGACGPESDATFMDEGECIPQCSNKCGVSDTCGGMCKCAAGVPCNPNGTCGNGCDLGAGEVCLVDAGNATTCCSSGFICFAHDSGVSACCAALGAGHCAQDTDCCDYPVAHCSTTTNTCG
ncbi:MAG TPA: hypothetical protein VIJ22_16960 [Polyangiaceae bacterium]